MRNLIVLAIMVVTVVLPSGRLARADTISVFNVLGNAAPNPPFTGTSFSGTLTVDVTTGTALAIDVTFPGLPAFDVIETSFGTRTAWIIDAFSSNAPSHCQNRQIENSGS